MKVDLYCNDRRLLKEIQLADTFISRLRGYMFYKVPPVSGIAFKPCNSIHTFFMKFPIDVLFLNEQGQVLKKSSYLKKGRVIKPVKGGQIVVESLGGVFSDVNIGDTIELR